MSKNLPQRKDIELKYYDYSLEGSYFITICTRNKECILPTIKLCRDKTYNGKVNIKLMKKYNIDFPITGKYNQLLDFYFLVSISSNLSFSLYDGPVIFKGF